MLFDVHTHMHFPVYDSDRDQVLSRAKAAGVKMISVGTQAASSDAAVKLARENPGEVWATAGFHPNHFASAWYHDPKEQVSGEREEFDAARLAKIAAAPEVVAIGECGLDYYRETSDTRQATRKRQKEAFGEQIKIAQKLNKPLMIHSRPSRGSDDAYEDVLGILNPKPSTLNPIMHFYVGSLAMTKKLVSAGAYFTFGGVITFSRDYDEVIKYIPLDRILLETDAPYAAPAPHRGKRNEPAYIVEAAKKLAEIKGISPEMVAEQTTTNAVKVFKIKLK